MSRPWNQWAAACLSLVLVSSLACGDDDGTSPLVGCTSDVSSVTVTTGGTPRFSWTPACGVNELVVRDVEYSDVMWRIWGDDADNYIRSGIAYGTVPAGISEPDENLELVPGRTYTVVLYRYGIGDPDPVGSREWTHSP